MTNYQSEFRNVSPLQVFYLEDYVTTIRNDAPFNGDNGHPVSEIKYHTLLLFNSVVKIE